MSKKKFALLSLLTICSAAKAEVIGNVASQLNSIEPDRFNIEQIEDSIHLIRDTSKAGAQDIALYQAVSGAHFSVDSATLSRSILPHLNTLISQYKRKSSRTAAEQYIFIVGHTDSTGSRTYNQQLSARRADAAAKYLIEHGVPHHLIYRIAAGQDYPLVANNHAANMAQNRRVEVFVTDDLPFVESFYRQAECFDVSCDSRDMQLYGFSRNGSLSQQQKSFQDVEEEQRGSIETKKTYRRPLVF